MALACHHYHVPGPGGLQSSLYRRPSIQQDLTTPRTVPGPRRYLSGYLSRILGVGVVGGYYAQLREVRRYSAHQRTLRHIPVSGRPEHTDHTPRPSAPPPRGRRSRRLRAQRRCGRSPLLPRIRTPRGRRPARTFPAPASSLVRRGQPAPPPPPKQVLTPPPR